MVNISSKFRINDHSIHMHIAKTQSEIFLSEILKNLNLLGFSSILFSKNNCKFEEELEKKFEIIFKISHQDSVKYFIGIDLSKYYIEFFFLTESSLKSISSFSFSFKNL
jgi:hypothetical protein